LWLWQIKIQAQEAINLIEKKEDLEILLSSKQFLIWNTISQSEKAMSISQIANISNLSISTVKQGVNKLIKLNKVERLGQGRAVRYRQFEEE
jgi:DNA-binding MarR family transcriptional regulator